jgi:hypothetical protein
MSKAKNLLLSAFVFCIATTVVADELLQLQRDLVLQAVPVAGLLLLEPAPQPAHQRRPH